MSVSASQEANNTVRLQRFPGLHLQLDTPKGRGVFSSTMIFAGTILDTSPVLVLDPAENTTHIENTTLYHYTYNWPLQTPSGKVVKTQAVVLGLGSLFNHSTRNQNVGWYRDLERQVVLYTALRDIEVGEELCISYGDRLTFVDVDANGETKGDRESSSSDEDGDGTEVLGRINLET